MSTFISNYFPISIYVMAKPIGFTCNLNGFYCYYPEKKELYENRNTFHRNNKVPKRYTLKHILPQPMNDILSTRHGKETWLITPDFYWEIPYFRKYYERKRKTDKFLIGISIVEPEMLLPVKAEEVYPYKIKTS
ncbi:MAG: hypothetical protein LUG18_08625 [Candidatus Azobacteroides sp.]|nr:hypothetical protein [Candidatus Azobacteroides sp.]